VFASWPVWITFPTVAVRNEAEFHDINVDHLTRRLRSNQLAVDLGTCAPVGESQHESFRMCWRAMIKVTFRAGTPVAPTIHNWSRLHLTSRINAQNLRLWTRPCRC